MSSDKALVLLSGGQDSATCLLWAKHIHKEVEAISFTYGQKHSRELEAGDNICKLLNIQRTVIGLPFISNISVSSLLNSTLEGQHPLNDALPASFLPGRNVLFLTIAAMYAYTKEINILVGGMCQTDYSGYPDCRRTFIDYLELAFDRGFARDIYIVTPLMFLSKADSIKLALSLPLGKEILKLSHTCYKGENPPCGTCPACIIRAKGFSEVGITDPILEG